MVPLLLHFTYTSLAFGFMSLGETVIYCGPEGFLMWEISCVASMSLMFFCVRAVFIMDAPRHVFPHCMLAITPLTGECGCCRGDQSLH